MEDAALEAVLNRLADAVQETRQRLGMTQREFADRVGVGQTAISFWEQGRGVPRLEQICLLASVRGELPEHFFAFLMGRDYSEPRRKPIEPLEALLAANEEKRLRAAYKILGSVVEKKGAE